MLLDLVSKFLGLVSYGLDSSVAALELLSMSVVRCSEQVKQRVVNILDIAHLSSYLMNVGGGGNNCK
jgi:hypothetical protein